MTTRIKCGSFLGSWEFIGGVGIAMDMKTKEQLKQFGTDGQTYQDILQNLMEVAKMH